MNLNWNCVYTTMKYGVSKAANYVRCWVFFSLRRTKYCKRTKSNWTMNSGKQYTEKRYKNYIIRMNCVLCRFNFFPGEKIMLIAHWHLKMRTRFHSTHNNIYNKKVRTITYWLLQLRINWILHKTKFLFISLFYCLALIKLHRSVIVPLKSFVYLIWCKNNNKNTHTFYYFH